MNPEQQAEVLARWLQSRSGRGLLGPAPEGLDEDVAEAVYALRPDLAPAPTVTIEEILATVDQAPHLAAWLDGDEDGSSLDPDVAEAVYALDPSRAPAPRVSIDDVLARLTGGPLATSQAADSVDDGQELAEVVQFPVRAPREEPELVPANTPNFGRNERQRSRDRWWPWLAGSGVAGALAAALAALVIGPELLTNGAPEPDMARQEAPATTAPAVEAESKPMDEVAIADSTVSGREDVVRERVAAADPAPPPVADNGYWDQLEAAGPKEKKSEVAAKSPAPTPMSPTTPDDGGEAIADLFDGEDAEDDLAEAEEYWARDASGVQAGAGGGLFGGDVVEEPASAPALDVEMTTESRRSAPKVPSRPGRPKASASNSDIPAEPEGLARGAKAPVVQASTGSAAVSGPDLSSLDPAAQARLRDLHTRADAFAAQGRWLDAAKTLTPAIAGPPQVGQWYATQVARWYLQAGEPQSAMDAADLGFSLGGSRSPQLQAVYDEAALAASPRPPAAAKPAY